MLLPGIKINTAPDHFYPIRQMQLAAFDGESWQLFGDLIGNLRPQGSAIGMWKNWPMQHNCPVCSTGVNPHQRVDCS